jgi:hypothetical protein
LTNNIKNDTLKYIIKYQNFSESKGISDSCEKVLYKVWGDIESDIIDLKSNELIFDIDESDFKCRNIDLKITISKSDDNLCNAQTHLKESKIIDGYLTNVIIKIDIKYKKLDDEFIYYIKSVLLHELLHIFQHYNILLGNKFRPESFSIGSIIPQLRNIVKTKYGNYFLDILYHSLSHELSAQIHQYYLHKMNNRHYKRLYDIKNLISNFKINSLDKDEEDDVILIKKHIVESINYLSLNLNYKDDIERSIWNESDIYVFLENLKKLLDRKVKWINKKINLVNKKIKDSKIIKYDENTTLPHDWVMYDLSERNDFIKENLSDSSNIEFI